MSVQRNHRTCHVIPTNLILFHHVLKDKKLRGLADNRTYLEGSFVRREVHSFVTIKLNKLASGTLEGYPLVLWIICVQRRMRAERQLAFFIVTYLLPT